MSLLEPFWDNHTIFTFCGQSNKVISNRVCYVQRSHGWASCCSSLCDFLSPINFLTCLTESINQLGWEFFLTNGQAKGEGCVVLPRLPWDQQTAFRHITLPERTRTRNLISPGILAGPARPERLASSDLSLLQFLLSSTWRRPPQEAWISCGGYA